MAKTHADRTHLASHQLGHGLHFCDGCTRFRQRAGNLVHEDGASETPSPDKCTLFAGNGTVVSDDDELHRSVWVRDCVLLLGQTEKQNVAGAAAGDCRLD
jgi:hypothetical protein